MSEDARRSRWADWGRMAAGFASVLLLLEFVHGLGFDWFRWHASVEFNPALLEGYSWHFGQLSLPHGLWDTAYVEETNRAYNVFPPLQSIIGYVGTVGHGRPAQPGQFPELNVIPLLFFGLPLPIVGYWVFRQRVGGDAWAAVLTLGWIGGSALLPCMEEARRNGVHHINHLLSQVGLLILAGELLREPAARRLWLAWIGLLISVWSRQLTIVYGVALFAAALGGAGESRLGAAELVSQENRHRGRGLRRRVGFVCVGIFVIVAPLLCLNWAKFGSPFRSGYELIYVGRDTDQARDARAHGLFSTAFLGRNAYYMNAAIPWARSDEENAVGWRPSPHGASMWVTTPILALVLLGLSNWGRDVSARTLMLCTLPIIAALLLYHNTGYRQYGYYRFALDFLPVWLIVGAQWMTQGWRRWATGVCVVWSVGYYAILSRTPAAMGG